MTAVVERWRPAPLLRGRRARRPLAFLALAGISFALAALAVVVACLLAQGWQARDRLAGDLTIVVRGRGLESADAAAARAVEILGRLPEVDSARALEPAPADAPIADLVGLPAAGGASSPRLIAVNTRAAAPEPPRGLASALRAEGIAAGVDDHGPWSSPVAQALGVAGALAAALILGMALLAQLILRGAGRGLIAARPDLVGLLIAQGAPSAFLAKLPRGPLIGLAVGASLLGIAAAGASLAVLRLPGAWPSGAPPLRLEWLDLAPMAVWPAVCVLFALRVCRRTAEAALATQP